MSARAGRPRWVVALACAIGLATVLQGGPADGSLALAEGTAAASRAPLLPTAVTTRSERRPTAAATDRSIALYWPRKPGATAYRVSVRTSKVLAVGQPGRTGWTRRAAMTRLPKNSRQYLVTTSFGGDRLVNGRKYQVRLQYRVGARWRSWATLVRTPRDAQPNAAAPCGVAVRPASWDHVVWIIMENHGSAQTVGSSAAPYFNSLIDSCGLADNFFAITHPSLPNYLAMTSGSTQGVGDDKPPVDHQLAVPNIFAQLGPGRWRTLAESMPGNCAAGNAGDYVARHNPATYYSNVAAQCATQDLPLTGVPDISARFTLIVPNNKSNTHDTQVRYGDAWLAGFVPLVLDSPQYRAGRTVVFITYDEDSGAEDNHIPAVVMAPSVVPRTRDMTRYTLYSLLRTTEEILGVPALANAADAPSMRSAFHL